MKTFFITLLLFSIAIGCIIWNALYIGKVTGEINTFLEKMPAIDNENCLSCALEIQDYWEVHLPTVGLSVSYPVVDRISEQAATLSACAACGDHYGFQTALALLKDAIGDMCRLEKFSIANLM